MVVCKFFVQGNCRFGDQCKFEHPGRSTNANSRNPFAPLQNNPGPQGGPNPARGNPTARDLPYKLDKATITNDLSKERPQWILSAYGPGRDAPLQLFGGHLREQSFEELRIRHYELATQGNQQQAIQEAQALVNNAEQQIQTALNDVDGAVKYIINGENEHPNRLDVCKAKDAMPGQPQTLAPNQRNTSTFGQPSSSMPAFGQPSAPSVFGRHSAPSFAQPSASNPTFGQPSAPTFGQPSRSSAFGQPSALGRPTTSFGQPSSSFGQPSISAPAFSRSSAPNPLGAPQQQSQANAFGKPSGPDLLPQQTVAATNPFSQPSGLTQNPTFGQPSVPSQPSTFGRPSTLNPSPAVIQPATSGAIGGFSQTSTAPPNPFDQPKAPSNISTSGQSSTVAPNPFGQTMTSSANQPGPSIPSNISQPPPDPAVNRANVKSTSGQGTNGVQVQRDSQNKVTSWKGMLVRYFDDEPCYRNNDGSWQKLWFPDGPPDFRKTVELPDEAYDEATKANYGHLKETGTFKDGIMPLLPPKREWCSWNF